MSTLRESYEAKGAIITPAGIWERDEDGKKKPIVAFRADGLSFANFPTDNIAKFRIEQVTAPADKRLIIIDADSQEGKNTVEKIFPQTANTFSYQTSQPYKRHYWFYVPTDKFEEFRAVGAMEDVDILTYGIAFTAHFFRDADYKLPNFELPILELDEMGVEIILASLDEKNTSYGRGDHTSFVNKEMAVLVIAYVDGKLDISEKDHETKANRNKLFKQITPKILKKKGQRKFEAPALSHDTLNTMALLVAKNNKIPNDIAVKFIEKLLVEVYELNLNSKLTQVHWYNSILPTLPFFEALFNPMEDFREFDEIVLDNSTDNAKDRNFKWVLFGTTKNGAPKFMQINRFTYKLRNINGVTLFDESYIRKWYPHLAKDDMDSIPQLAITANPYEDIVIFDEENDVHTLNTLHPSPYKLGAVANKSKPKNILTEMIELFFDDEQQEDYYYHWLAHIMYGDKPVNVVMWFCSDSNAEAGTGKEQPLTAKVSTPNGWLTMGDMTVGQVVSHPTQGQTRVKAVHPQGIKRVYEVHLKDGSIVECGKDHLWQVEVQKNYKTLVKPLSFFLEEELKTKSGYKYCIPLTNAIEYPTGNLMLEPYLLGALIADGSLLNARPAFSYHQDDEAIREEALAYLPLDVRQLGTRHTSNKGVQVALSEELNAYTSALGINVSSADRRVPKEYLIADIEQRTRLLRGLMDCDGNVKARNRVTYSTSSKGLARDIIELIQSLGGVAYIIHEDTRQANVNYTVNVAFNDFNPFLLQRKAVWVSPRKQNKVRQAIVKIVETDRYVEQQCITVEAKDGLYITDNFAVTHNTLLSASLPAQLVGFDQATTVDSNVASAGWGQIYETKLLSYNDLNKMKDTEWDNLYAKIKDEATNSTSKLRNNKGGDIMKSMLGVCQSGSSNFIPKVDSSDRRFFIVSPKLKLGQDGADQLHYIFEDARTEEHKEIQEIANYLAHLYKDERNKFRTELYTRALVTAEKIASTQMGAYTQTIIPRIQHNPRELFDIFKETTEFNSEWQDWQVIAFIKLQTFEGRVYLPTEFLNYLINRVKGVEENRGVAQTLSVLHMKKEKLGEHGQDYKDLDRVIELGLPTFICEYATYGIITEITEQAYNNFTPKKIQPIGVAKLGAK